MKRVIPLFSGLRPTMPHRCAVPGCSASSDRCKGLAFFNVKRKGNKDWTDILVDKINRCDRSFNLDNAKICSRHFEETCLTLDHREVGSE